MQHVIDVNIIIIQKDFEHLIHRIPKFVFLSE